MRGRLGGAALWAIAASASAQSFTYEPETCRTDAEGMVYLRLLSGVAFALPVEEFRSLPEAPDLDPAPFDDLSEPMGCPDRPIPTRSVGLFYTPVLPRHPEEPEGRWRPQGLEVFGHLGPVSLQRGKLRLFQRCINDVGVDYPDSHPSTVETVLGTTPLQLCRWRTLIRDPLDHRAYFAVAIGENYPRHDGVPFVVSCYPFFEHTCEVRYAISDGLSVSYKFSDLDIRPEHFIDFDLMIRALIEARRRPELDWE